MKAWYLKSLRPEDPRPPDDDPAVVDLHLCSLSSKLAPTRSVATFVGVTYSGEAGCCRHERVLFRFRGARVLTVHNGHLRESPRMRARARRARAPGVGAAHRGDDGLEWIYVLLLVGARHESLMVFRTLE